MAVALAFRRRARTNSLSTVTPPVDSVDYDLDYESLASRILYKSPLPSSDDLPVYILDSAAFPDTQEVNYDALLPYVLARLPSEEELIGGRGYELVFFAGGDDTATTGRKMSGTTGSNVSDDTSRKRKHRPGWSWLLQAYHILSRAMRKRLQRLYLVHERRWVRVAAGAFFSTVVSSKFRRKVFHCSTISDLALHLPVEDLLIPPSAYEGDRRFEQRIYSPYATGCRAFGANKPLPIAVDGQPRLPRVLRETTNVLLNEENIKTEGLFRINARMQTLEILKDAYDRGQKFVVWKEGQTIITFDQWKDGHGEVSSSELEQLGGYSVHTAAGLTKLWYSNLREPLFPESSYLFLSRTLDTKDLELPVIMDLVSMSSEWSPLPKESRLILTTHLFPMLARIADHADQNKMTASNLSVCFAPALLHGPDPLEDAKMTRTVTKIIEYAVKYWDDGLSESCGMGGKKFDDLLKIPSDPADREDPLSSSTAASPTLHNDQTEGIVMLQQDDSDSSDETDKPPLPPRLQTQTAPATETTALASPLVVQSSAMERTPSVEQQSSAIKRKPAPPLQNPPRYSTIFTNQQQDTTSLPPYRHLGGTVEATEQKKEEQMGH